MRKLLVCMAVFFPFPWINAQTTLEKETHLFRPGDYLIKQQVEFTDLSTPGEELTWDLSKIKTAGEPHKVSYLLYADSIILSQEYRTLYKYILKEDTLFSTGMENQLTLINYPSQPELHLIYPVNYGNTREAFYYGTGDYCKQLDLILKGKSTYHADAWGTIYLPEGDTIQNVLRIHHTKIQVEEQYPHYSFSILDSISSEQQIATSLATDTLLTKTDTYRWYAPGYRYPVFETVHQQAIYKAKPATIATTAFYYPPHEQYYGLEHDVENFAVRERMEMEKEKGEGSKKSRGRNNDETTGIEDLYTQQGFTYCIETAKEMESVRVSYELYQQEEVEILLTDMQGRTLERMPKRLYSNGSYSYTFSLLDYPRGEYLIRINAAAKGYTEKIMK